MRGIVVRGIVPAEEATVTELAAGARTPRSPGSCPASWQRRPRRGAGRSLRVRKATRSRLILPGGQVTPPAWCRAWARSPSSAPSTPATSSTTTAWRWSHLDDAIRLFQLDGPTGLRLRLKDLEQAPRVAAELEHALGAARASCATGPDQPQLVRLGADPEAPDVHHPDADRRGGRVQPGVDAGDDGDRQARRHRHPAHARRDAALGDGHLHGPGRGLGRDRHARRRAARPAASPTTSTSSCRRSSGCCTSASCRAAST